MWTSTFRIYIYRTLSLPIYDKKNFSYVYWKLSIEDIHYTLFFIDIHCLSMIYSDETLSLFINDRQWQWFKFIFELTNNEKKYDMNRFW